MKLMRLAICVAAFAVVGGIAVSEDMDIKALQAKLAAQEARLNDLQAKMGSGKAETPANIISMRKNAKVTIGGLVDTRYLLRSGKVESVFNPTNFGRMEKIQDYKGGDLRLANAKLAVKIDVNEHMDAYLRVDFNDSYGRQAVSHAVQYYWVRWKNICNSGFGLLVGRDDLKFGLGKPVGIIDAYNQDPGPAGVGDVGGFFNTATNNFGDGMFVHGNMMPAHISYGSSRVTQINPYWENACKTFKAELSLFQGIDRYQGTTTMYEHNRPDGIRYKRGINYGLGSGALRLTWKPTEDLTFVAGLINLHAQGRGFANDARRDGNAATVFGTLTNLKNGTRGYMQMDKNNYGYHIGVKYNPDFFCKKLTLWANMTQEWNAAWVDDMDVINANAGLMYAFTDKFTGFVQGDYIRSKNDQSLLWNKATGWGTYIGAQYKLGGGALLEAGWKHDSFDYKSATGVKHTKLRADTIYANLRFTF